MHLTWPRRRSRWMLNKQSAYALERSCSTGRGAGSSVGGVPWFSRFSRRGAPCWPKFPGGLARAARLMGGAMCTLRGRG